MATTTNNNVDDSDNDDYNGHTVGDADVDCSSSGALTSTCDGLFYKVLRESFLLEVRLWNKKLKGG